MNRLTRNTLPLLIAWLLISWPAAVAAQSPAVVYVEPAEPVLQIGETTTLVISVKGAADLFGIELRLLYDPAVVQVLDDDAGREGVQLASGSLLDPAGGFMVVNSADNEAGELEYAMTLLAPAEAVSGDGILATFDIQALSNGTSPLTLSAILASAEGAALPVVVEGGRVTVGDEQTNAPSPPAPSSPTPFALTATAAPAAATSSGETPPPTATAVGLVGGSRTATPAEMPSTTNSGSETTGTTESSVETEPTTSLQFALPALSQSQGDGSETDQPGTQDQATSQEGGQATVSSPTVPGPATPGQIIPSQGAAVDSESQTESNNGSLMAGGVVLIGFLLIAAVIFFGRRLLSRE